MLRIEMILAMIVWHALQIWIMGLYALRVAFETCFYFCWACKLIAAVARKKNTENISHFFSGIKMHFYRQQQQILRYREIGPI